MSTLTNNKRKFRRAYVPSTALAKEVGFTDEMMLVTLTDGRIITVPLLWFPILESATPEQRHKYEIGMGGRSLHWPEIDEDLSVTNLLAGGDTHST